MTYTWTISCLGTPNSGSLVSSTLYIAHYKANDVRYEYT